MDGPEVAVTDAPSDLAIWTAKWPTPPAPQLISAESSSFRPPTSRNARKVVTRTIGSDAVTMKLSVPGLRMVFQSTSTWK